MNGILTLEERRRKLGHDLKPHIEALLGTVFLRDLESARLDPKKVGAIFSQYRHYCSGFTGFLEILLQRTNSPIVQKPLLENLWEERGSGNANLSHVTMLDDFVVAWGVATGLTPEEAKRFPKAEVPVTSFLNDIREHLQKAPLAAAFGFIGPGTEEVTSEQYARFLKGLRSYGLVAEEKLAFFDVHIAADIQHANFFWQALEQVALTESDWDDVTAGAKHSLTRETKFWNEMVGTK